MTTETELQIRNDAFEWWEHTKKNAADRIEWKVTLCDKYFGYDKNYTRLTDDEIIEMYKKEHPQEKQSVDSIKDNEYWENEINKCKNSPYYYATKYLTVNGKPFTTMLNETEFNTFFKNL